MLNRDVHLSICCCCRDTGIAKQGGREDGLVLDCSRRPGAGDGARNELIERVRKGEVEHVTVVGSGWLGAKFACQLKVSRAFGFCQVHQASH